MNVLLLCLPTLRFDRTLDYLQAEFAAVAAFLGSCGDFTLHVVTAGLTTPPLRAVFAEVIDARPDVIVLYVDVCEADECTRVASQLAAVCPGVRIVVFGDATVWIPQFFERAPFDAVVLSGDPELVLLDYLHGVEASEAPPHGMSFRGPSGYLRGPTGRLLDPSLWPFPLRAVVPVDAYDRARRLRGQETNDLSFIVGKGCHVGCVWCVDPYKSGRTDRRRPVAKTVEFMASGLHGYDCFQLHCPIFSRNRTWVAEFVATMREHKLNIPFKCVTLVGDMKDDQLVGSLAEVGLRSVGMGVETLSERRRLIRKYDQSDLPLVADTLRRHGVQGVCYTQVGLAGQTRSDIYYTHALLTDLGFAVRPTGATPFHLLRGRSVEDLERSELWRFDRKSFFSPACGLTQQEFYRLLVASDPAVLRIV